jgi:hypothetical protein
MESSRTLFALMILKPHPYALLVLHPIDTDEQLEHRRARMTLRAIELAGAKPVVIVYPNNDPGQQRYHPRCGRN